MLTNKLMGAAGGADKVYIEDVFSTYLYTGNGASQTITNGIALGDEVNIPIGTALAGGYFGGFISTSGTGVATHALIVAPKSSGENASKQWKTTDATTAGTTSDIDGPANSAAMNNASHPAAQFCEGLTIGGYSDWYMPAKNELEVLYYFLKPTTQTNNISSGSNANAVSPEPISTNYSSGSPAQTSAAAFQSGGAEAFAADDYWSSTEYSATGAWVRFFGNGLQANVGKSYSLYVRAVRRVAIADAILDPYRVTGKGGLVWLKSRSAATDHALYDTVRGATFDLVSNSTAAQTTQATGLTAFGSTGFSIGALAKINTSAATYASWTFREQAKFFDVVTYTGNATNPRTIAHNLGSVPGMIIVKRTDTTGDWWTYHISAGAGAYLKLNTTDASVTSASFWGTGPTSTDFIVNAGALNASGGTYVAYLFAHDAGGFGAAGTDNVISCGSFTSNGAVLPITLGYEPQWLLFKPSSGVGDWELIDNMRGFQVDRSGATVDLKPNTSAAEAAYGIVGPTSTGFTFNNGGTGVTYIYMAIRRGPMRTPTDGTKVFSPLAVTAATGTQRTTGFPVDTQLSTIRAGGWSKIPYTLDRLRGVSTVSSNQTGFPVLTTSSTAAEASADYYSRNWGSTGFEDQAVYNANSVVYWNFRRAPGFFDVVCYDGRGPTFPGRNVFHNLGVKPELIISRARNATGDWYVTSPILGVTGTQANILKLNSTIASTSSQAFYASIYWDPGVYNVGTDTSLLSASGATYVAYLFATVPNVSKVGSYTGTGAAQTINCGFTAGARFVLIKRTDSTGDWYTFDTARGMVSGTDPYLLMNSQAAEVNANNVFTSSTGFTIQAAAPAGINASGGTFIYLAVA